MEGVQFLDVGVVLTIVPRITRDGRVLLHVKPEVSKGEVNPETGLPVFNLATAFSLMMFYAFAMQCASTVAVVYRETKSWKWPAIQFAYMTVLAYGVAFITYQLLK